MTQLIIDPMDDATRWKALAPDGVTPSTELSITNDTTLVRFETDKKSGLITASVKAKNHLLRQNLPAALDLTGFDEIRLWLWSNRVANGSLAQPFFLEMRLASAAMGLQDPANGWMRSFQAPQAGEWQFVRLGLGDLPSPVRSAVNQLQLRCVDATTAFTCYLNDILAVHEEVIGDVDAALLEQLHQKASIAGTPVPAFLTHPENPPQAVIPSIRITQYDIQYSRERTTSVRARSDFTTTTFLERPMSIAYDLYYFIDVYADTRANKTQVMEFVLHTLSPSNVLIVNATEVPIEWVTIEPLDDTRKWRSDRELLYFKVATRQEVGIAEPVTPPYQAITVEVDQKV